MENENTAITLNGPIADWTLPPTDGDVQGTYTGHFQFKCYLNPTEQLEAGREYRNLLGSNAILASDTEGNLAFALTQLKARVVKSPPFWSATLQHSAYAGNLPDLNIIMIVLNAAVTAENLYKEKTLKERNLVLDHAIKVGEELLQKQQGSDE